MGFIIGLTKDSFIQIRTYYMSNGYLKRRWVWHDDSSLQLASCRPSTDLLQLPHPLHLGNFKNNSFGFEQKKHDFTRFKPKTFSSQKGDNLDFLSPRKMDPLLRRQKPILKLSLFWISCSNRKPATVIRSPKQKWPPMVQRGFPLGLRSGTKPLGLLRH